MGKSCKSTGGMRFNQFPVELLSNITYSIDAFDICHLVFCGDGALNLKLFSGGVTEFRLLVEEQMPKQGVVRWPTLISRLSALRSLTVVVNPKYSSNTTLVSHVRLDMIPTSVQRMHLAFLQAESCFLRFPTPPNVSFPHQFEDSAYIDMGTFSDSESCSDDDDDEAGYLDMNDQPSTFAKLKASVRHTIDTLPSPPSICVNNQKNHPESAWTIHGIFNFKEYLPNLLELSLDGSPALSPQDLEQFPPTLQHLRLTFQNNLRMLKKTHIERISFLKVVANWNANLFPNLIKNLSHIQAPSILPQTRESFLVTKLVLDQPDWEWNLSLLPPSLTYLGIIRPKTSSPKTSVDVPWPKDLTSLDLDTCRWPEKWPPKLCVLKAKGNHELTLLAQVLNLPRSLRSLKLMTAGHLDWTVEHTTALPDLETCHLGASWRDAVSTRAHLEALPRSITDLLLGPLPTAKYILLAPPNLKILSLTLLRNINKLAKHLPRSLEELTFSPRGKPRTLDAQFSKSLPIGLKSFTLSSGKITHDFLHFLPPHLLKLVIWGGVEGRPSPLTILKLPQTLTQINLPSHVYTEDDYMVLLPRSVTQYDLILGCSLDGATAKHLPPSMWMENQYTDCVPVFDTPDQDPAM